MPNQFRKSRIFGAVVIAMSLVSSSVSAASNQALSLARTAPTPITATLNGADIVQVQDRRDGARARNHGRYERGSDRRVDRRSDRRVDRRDGRRHDRADRRFDRRGNDARYRQGYRGSRNYRPAQRRDNDRWLLPLAGIALGAAILNQQNRTRSASPAYTPTYGSWNHIPSGNMAAHDNWCDQQYRSYSRSTKTFQPYNGPRKYCNSPFDRL